MISLRQNHCESSSGPDALSVQALDEQKLLDQLDRPAASPGSAPAVRDLTLDVVKGTLVVVMVVYHAMNIFSTAGPDEYAYVRFVSGSFILMSGYIIARFDGPRFKADWRGTYQRLVARGLKLLILFTLLNLLINLTGIGNPDKVQ